MSHAECEKMPAVEARGRKKRSASHEIELNIETYSVSHLVKCEAISLNSQQTTEWKTAFLLPNIFISTHHLKRL